MKLFKWILPLMIVILGGSFFLQQSNNQEPQVITSGQLPILERALLDKEPNFLEKRVRDALVDMEFDAKSVILMDAHTGYILYESNIDVSLPAASMSKIMSELLVLDAIRDGKLSWEQEVPISDYAMYISTYPGLASVYLKQNETYSVRELFQAMAIRSGNDATIALAEAVAGSEKEFVAMMNERAQQLGMQNTTFVNSSGLNNRNLGPYYSTGSRDDDNRMSARDLAILAREFLNEYPTIMDMISQPSFTMGGHTYSNTNWMLPQLGLSQFSFAGVDGLKTGFTNEAGYCFVGTVDQDGRRLISVVMGTDSMEERFLVTKELYEVAFEQINKR